MVEFTGDPSTPEDDYPKVSTHHSHPVRNGQVEWGKNPQRPSVLTQGHEESGDVPRVEEEGNRVTDIGGGVGKNYGREVSRRTSHGQKDYRVRESPSTKRTDKDQLVELRTYMSMTEEITM